MKNWSTNTSILRKNPAEFRLLKTEQLINFGLGKAKLNGTYIKNNLEKLSIDTAKKNYLTFLLCPRKFSQKTKKNS